MLRKLFEASTAVVAEAEVEITKEKTFKLVYCSLNVSMIFFLPLTISYPFVLISAS